MPERCRSCNAEVVWAETERGKAIPLDSEPSLDGNLVLEVGPTGSTARYITHREREVPGGVPRYVSHFATCPDAGKWRKRDG